MCLSDFVPRFERAVSHLDAPEEEGLPVPVNGEPLEKGQFGLAVHPRIYPSGLVMLNPRWTPGTYAHFYHTYYDRLYRLDLKPDYGREGVIRHMKEVWERTGPVFSESRRPLRTVLDAGSGPGYGLGYLMDQDPGLDIHAIEASPDAREILEHEVGATIVDEDIDGPWVQRFKGRFDLVVMRHVVEHLLTPVQSLTRLRESLSEDGLIYIAVPDMMHPRTVLRDYEDWWEYWFRAVHPYYYCKETLFRTLRMSGLSPVAFGEINEEVWCLAGRSDVAVETDGSVFNKQMKVLRDTLPSS